MIHWVGYRYYCAFVKVMELRNDGNKIGTGTCVKNTSRQSSSPIESGKEWLHQDFNCVVCRNPNLPKNIPPNVS